MPMGCILGKNLYFNFEDCHDLETVSGWFSCERVRLPCVRSRLTNCLPVWHACVRVGV